LTRGCLAGPTVSRTRPSHEVTSQRLDEPAANTTVLQKHTTSLTDHEAALTLLSPTVAVNMSSRRPSQDSDISEVIWPDEIPDEPTDAQLSISPVTTVISRAPLLKSQRADLTPTEANTKVFICAAVGVAAGVALWGLSNEMFSTNSVLNSVVALIVVASVYITLRSMAGGRLRP
jgi:hypothetical protein